MGPWGPLGPKKVENRSKKVENNKLSHPGTAQRGTIFQDLYLLGPFGTFWALRGPEGTLRGLIGAPRDLKGPYRGHKNLEIRKRR